MARLPVMLVPFPLPNHQTGRGSLVGYDNERPTGDRKQGLRMKVVDLAFDLGGCSVDTADALDRQHGAQARPTAQGIEDRRLSAGEHPAPLQAAMRIVKRVAVSPARCTNAEAVLVEGFHQGSHQAPGRRGLA